MSDWLADQANAHLRDDASVVACSKCHRHSWVNRIGERCDMVQPDRTICDGTFEPLNLLEWMDAQAKMTDVLKDTAAFIETVQAWLAKLERAEALHREGREEEAEALAQEVLREQAADA